MVLPGFFAGMGFNSLPPLPIFSKPFGFLKSFDLRTVGLNLSDLPVKFGGELVLCKPVVEQARFEAIFEFGLDFGGWGTESESIPDVGGFEIGAEPVSGVGQGETEPSPAFEDFVGSSFDDLDRIADVESDEEPQTPLKSSKPNPCKFPNLEKVTEQSVSKHMREELISRLFVNCWACEQNCLPLLHNRNHLPQNPLPNLPKSLFDLPPIALQNCLNLLNRLNRSLS